MSIAISSAEAALKELDCISPDAPFLALGQTVFWDEPMKAGLILISNQLGFSRRLVAGVHDTDYFARHAGHHAARKYVALPHNDTTTRDLWSAVGEFSCLFGSETVITRDILQKAGLRVRRVARERPNLLDEATEAWGWKGIVSTSGTGSIANEVPLKDVFPTLKATFDWALDASRACIVSKEPRNLDEKVDFLKSLLCDTVDACPDTTVAGYYRKLLPQLYRFCSGADVDLDTTSTSELLRFNNETACLPRFDIVNYFIDPETRFEAAAAYDRAIEGGNMYSLSMFGTGAIPFDLVIPGIGRGTIRLGTRGAVIMAHKPQFLSFKKPIRNVRELAQAVVAKFGTECALVGKAVTLIGMLAKEFVFVFHEGASGYVKHSRKLFASIPGLKLNPILRVHYHAWDSMHACCSWLKLPEQFQRPFGVEQLCTPSFAARWREVGEQQKALLAELSKLVRPIDLIRFLGKTAGGSWLALATEYESLHKRLEGLKVEIEALRKERLEAVREYRALKQKRVEAELEKGWHWRDRIFGKEPTPEDLAERERLTQRVEEAVAQIDAAKRTIAKLLEAQSSLARAPEVLAVHERRRSIELEAELKRLSLIREAVICSDGLNHANHRPSAWWFPLVCPEGKWFHRTIESAEYYLEHLTP